ncbi:succinylglutamate-semialdehyde dehydrogenase [Hellea sp.]|nr:succinylglutamate-semialdehyde dehydrogenase [Hellea sp.]
MSKSLYINGVWQEGRGDKFTSANPSDGTELWSGQAASHADVELAFQAAHDAFEGWSRTPLKERMAIVAKYKELAIAAKESMGELIAKETGKQLWDALGEGGALSSKVDISLTAYEDRTGALSQDTAFGHAALQHRAHGVMAVLGPYNFPAHLPNGQILPALIAGNTVVFKPSEQTPAVGEALIKLYAEAGFPVGVINMVQGARETGAAILDHPKLDGVLFTGSAQTGAIIHKKFGGRPEIVLALEMGGNNPLIVWDVEDAEAAASIIAQSAFITTGQRCTCARRLIVADNPKGRAIIDAVADFIDRMSLGAWNEEATLGPLISADIAAHVVKNANALGGKVIREAKISEQGAAFITPGLYDVTGMKVDDEEIFGPILQVTRVADWDAAITEANNTKFGLAAGLISDEAALWEDFRLRIRAGVVNFNRPTTGAASFLPFGGPGASGNHSPGAYYAADFCAWPMASQVADTPENLPMKGLK